MVSARGFGLLVLVWCFSMAGCGSSSPGTSGTGGRPGSGGAGTGGSAGTGGTIDGGVADSAATTSDGPLGGAASGGSATSPTGGAGGTAGGSSGPTLASLCLATAGAAGAAGTSGAAGATGAAAVPVLTFTNQAYLGDSRVTPSEAIFSYINSSDDPHTQIMRLHNGGTAPVRITALHLVDNVNTATNPPVTPGARGGTLFPLNYGQTSLPSAFKVSTTASLPMQLAAGADLDVTVQFLSSKTHPPDRMLNIGGHAVSAVLIAQTEMGCVPAGLYGVGLWNDSETASDPATMLPSNNWARYEPTFGQIVATLGYRVNLGAVFIQLLNTNDMSIPGVGFSTEEVQVHKFTKADSTAPVQLLAVGRFAPPLDAPFGWYPIGSLTGAPGGTTGAGGAGGAAGGTGAGGTTGTAGAGGMPGTAGAGGAPVRITDAQPPAIPTTSTQASTQPAPLRVVATMQSSPRGVDWNTSNHSIQVLPPLRDDHKATTFDPGATPFGLWVFSNQRTTGNPTSAGVPSTNVGNGDYCYTENALNISAAQSHRVRVYPLKDRAGLLVPNSYLIGWEEASNGDYQDFIFIMKNVSPAP
ncbi:MAG: hypothetical protein ABIS92_00360 [Polyangia bacterium]